MAVFTSVCLDDLTHWITQFPLGKIVELRGISSGIENSNFFLTTETGEYVLTVFETLSFEQLPFYLELMRHLAQRGVLVPAPVADKHGQILHTLHGKPAAIVTKLDGACEMAPTPVHCAAVGNMMARTHLAAQDFPNRQANLRGRDWWNATAPTVLPYLSDEGQHLLRAEIHFQETFASTPTWHQLPRGPIHADLFRTNVMFEGERLTGFFDFYFAGYDTWLYDVAVAVNDWCIARDDGELDPLRMRALLSAYHAVRPFSEGESSAWQPMLRAAALRFWLSRLYDFHLPRRAEILTPHDPSPFERILRHRISHPAPSLY
jgi:homoserine kinase type II